MIGGEIIRKAGAFTVVSIMLLTVLLVPGCGGGEKSVRVRMGFLKNDLHQLAYYVARDRDFFTDEGVDVREGGAFNAGPEEMSAFSAGDIDMGYVGTAPALTFAAQGYADINIVAQANQEGSSIVVRSGLEASDVASLKGRTVAIPGFSTVQDMLLRMALEKAKMETKDVKMVALRPPEMIPALEGSQIDAFVAWEPYPSQAVEKGAGRVLADSRDIWPRHPCCMLVVEREFSKKNPETVRKVVSAHVKATEYIKANPLEAAYMARLFTGQDEKVVNRAMEKIDFACRPDVDGIKRYARFLKDIGIVKTDDTDGFVLRLVDERYLPGDGS